jgi:hydantoinase/carbamoylase family amidase
MDTTAVLLDIDALARITPAPPTISRLAYTPSDDDARTWFADRCKALGLRFEADRHGNCFGWAPGCDNTPAVLVGSHLDSVVDAGRYDGALGVVAGFELARRALASDPAAAVAIVSFACEESSRFGIGSVGSRLLVHELPDETLDTLHDENGTSLREAIATARLDPTTRSSFEPDRVACFLELHIDQGSLLAETDAIGIVDSIAGQIRLRVAFTGEVSHSGAHTRTRRRNALLGAARFVAAADELWSRIDAEGRNATITIGHISNTPNAANSVSGHAEVIVDLRSPDPGLLTDTVQDLEDGARRVATALGLETDIELLGRFDPVRMDPTLLDTLCRAAANSGADHRIIASMAGHDAEIIARHVPTAMLFAGNPAAVSHSPLEAVNKRSLSAALTVLESAIAEILSSPDPPKSRTAGRLPAPATPAIRLARRARTLRSRGRTDSAGRDVASLENDLAAFASRHRIDHDLTAADTAAFPPPSVYLDAIARAVRDGRPAYTALRGDIRVRGLLAPRLTELLGTPVEPDEIVLTAGTQAGLFASLSALVERGAPVLVVDPDYLCHERLLQYAGADVRYVPFARTGAGAALDLDAVEAGFRAGACGIVFSNPHNPTGSIIGADTLASVARLAVGANAWVVADELYTRFVYDHAPLVHMAALPEMNGRCVTAIGPSKTESASGLRIGVIVAPAALAAEIGQIVEITTVRAPAYAQYALEHWLTDDEKTVRDYLARYQQLRDIAVDRLSRIDGVTIRPPAATGWLFPDVSGLGRTDLGVVEALIDAAVLVMPGISFGPSGSGHLRISLAQPLETWPEVIDRVAKVLEQLKCGR